MSSRFKKRHILRERLEYEGALYHVTQRAPGKELLFIEQQDYRYFLKQLKKAAAEFNLTFFAFCLMPNHIHLLFRTNEKNLSQAMKGIFERHARFFNKKYKRKGHVFCGRFRASLCEEDRYLLAASIYIHVNPVKARLCEKAAQYRWSTASFFTNACKDGFVDRKRLLSLLGKDASRARKRYRELLKEAASVKAWSVREGRGAGRTIKAISGLVTPDESILGRMDIIKTLESIKKERRIVAKDAKAKRRYILEQLRANGYLWEDICEALAISKATYHRILRQNKPGSNCLIWSAPAPGAAAGCGMKQEADSV